MRWYIIQKHCIFVRNRTILYILKVTQLREGDRRKEVRARISKSALALKNLEKMRKSKTPKHKNEAWNIQFKYNTHPYVCT